MTIERILGTDTGKEAFGKTDRNFVALETALNNVSGAAMDITYDNTASQMTATNVQDAIDENKIQINSLNTKIGTIETQTIVENYLSAHSIPSTAKRGKLDVKLKGLSAINGIKGGNCESISNFAQVNYYSADAFVLDATTKISGSNSLKCTSASYSQTLKTTQNIRNGNKYYIALYAKTDIGFFYGAFNSNGVITNAPIYPSTNGNWRKVTISYSAAADGVFGILKQIGGTHLNIDDIMCIDLTSIFGAGNEPTKEQCDLMFANYFDGLQGASNIEVKSTGKNLFNKNDVEIGKYVAEDTGNLSTNAAYIASKFIKVKSNTTYILSGVIGQAWGGNSIWGYDLNFKPVIKLDNDGLDNQVFTTPSNVVYVRFGLNVGVDATQLEEGSVATAYEPYTSTEVTYKTLDGQPITLNRLPNGVVDEILDDGKYIKRNIEYALQASDITSLTTTGINTDYLTIPLNKLIGLKSQSDTAADGSILMYGFNGELGSELIDDSINNVNKIKTVGGTLYLVISKGTFANIAAAQVALAGTKIIYQLATSQILDTNAVPLIVEPNGHVFITPSSSLQPSAELNYPMNIGASLDSMFDNLKPISTLFSAISPVVFKERTILSAASDVEKLGTSDKMTFQIIQGNPISWDSNMQGWMITHKTTSGAYGSQVYGNQYGLWYRNLSASIWDGWQQIVTNKQASWITATLQNGWTGELQYRKNQLGQIEINFNITTGTITPGTVIANLPVGYRPLRVVVIPIYNGASAAVGAFLVVGTSGNVLVPSSNGGITGSSNYNGEAIICY